MYGWHSNCITYNLKGMGGILIVHFPWTFQLSMVLRYEQKVPNIPLQVGASYCFIGTNYEEKYFLCDVLLQQDGWTRTANVLRLANCNCCRYCYCRWLTMSIKNRLRFKSECMQDSHLNQEVLQQNSTSGLFGCCNWS